MCVCRAEDKFLESIISFTWNPGVEHRLRASVTKPFLCRSILPALIHVF